MGRGLPWLGRGVLLLSLLLGASSAQAAPDSWRGRDKAIHFGGSALAPPLGYAAGAVLFDRGEQGMLVGMALGLGVGLGKELYDIKGPGDASLKDLTCDVLGTVTGAALTWAVDRLFFEPARRRARARPPLPLRSDEERMRSLQRALVQQMRNTYLELRRGSVTPR